MEAFREFKGIKAKRYERRYFVLQLVPLRGEKNSNQPHKIGSRYLISDGSFPIYLGVPHGIRTV